MPFVYHSGLRPYLDPASEPANPMRSAPSQIGRVLGRHPAHQAITVALLGGGILQNVPLMTGDASGGSGTINIPEGSWGDGTAAPAPSGNVYAVIHYLGDKGTQPICVGFLPPEVNALSDLPAAYYQRLPGGSHHVIEPTSGSVEQWFGDGSYLRHATGDNIAHYQMAGQDFDGNYGDQAPASPMAHSLATVVGNLYTIWKDGALELTLPQAKEHGGVAVRIVCGAAVITVNIDGSIGISGTNITIAGAVDVTGTLSQGGTAVSLEGHSH